MASRYSGSTTCMNQREQKHPGCQKVRIAMVSDTHGRHRSVHVPYADILIHAGDFTHFGKREDAEDFNAWLGELPHQHKVVINGNHEANADFMREIRGSNEEGRDDDDKEEEEGEAGRQNKKGGRGGFRQLLSNATLLRDEAAVFAVGHGEVVVWGTEFRWPLSLEGGGLNPYDAIPATVRLGEVRKGRKGKGRGQDNYPRSVCGQGNRPAGGGGRESGTTSGGSQGHRRIDVLVCHSPCQGRVDGGGGAGRSGGKSKGVWTAASAAGSKWCGGGGVGGTREGGRGCPALRAAAERVSPQLVVCGHIHHAHGTHRATTTGGESESAETAGVAGVAGRSTLFVNAACAGRSGAGNSASGDGQYTMRHAAEYTTITVPAATSLAPEVRPTPRRRAH